jgi:hypothetical protein
MSAKKPNSGATPPPAASAPAAAAESTAPGSWLDSRDPKKRLWGKIILTALWVYVAALWLLALDQSFHWGIFGPKLPPLP